MKTSPACLIFVAAISATSNNANAVQSTAAAQANRNMTREAFEVASVRKDDQVGMPIGRFRMLPSGRFDAAAALRTIVTYAYEGEVDRVEGNQPILNDRFVIAAKAAEGAAADKQAERQMLQTLLLERFHLQAHVELRSEATAILRRDRPDRLGPFLIEKKSPCLSLEERNNDSIPGAKGEACSIKNINGHVTGTVKSMRDFALFLQQQTLTFVRDETELEGSFGVDFEFNPESVSTMRLPADSPMRSFPALSDALRDRLGLRLERNRAPAKILVIDQIATPIAN